MKKVKWGSSISSELNNKAPLQVCQAHEQNPVKVKPILTGPRTTSFTKEHNFQKNISNLVKKII